MLKEKFPDYAVGYSDHTLGSQTMCAAAALGAAVIEKHFNLLLFFTGLSRLSSRIQEKHEQAIRTREQQLLEMLALVDQTEAVLVSGDLDEFGRLLDYTWQLKRGVNAAVSNDMIDSIYATAKQAGALGGKLLGAGGGGFLLFYVQADKQASVRKALAQLKKFRSSLKTAERGCCILHRRIT